MRSEVLIVYAPAPVALWFWVRPRDRPADACDWDATSSTAGARVRFLPPVPDDVPGPWRVNGTEPR